MYVHCTAYIKHIKLVPKPTLRILDVLNLKLYAS